VDAESILTHIPLDWQSDVGRNVRVPQIIRGIHRLSLITVNLSKNKRNTRGF